MARNGDQTAGGSIDVKHDERKYQDLMLHGSQVVVGDYIINVDTRDSRRVPQQDVKCTPDLSRRLIEGKGKVLLIAAENGQSDLVRQVLSEGANYQFIEEDGETALFKTVDRGHIGVVDVLLSTLERRDFLLRYQDGKWLDTPLHRAVVKGNLPMVRKLLSYSPPLEIVTKYGMTPLALAAEFDRPEIFELLLSHGAYRFCLNYNNATPLHIAARKGSVPILTSLLKTGIETAYLEARNRAGDTPLFVAVKFGQAATANLLIDARAMVQVHDNEQWTLLHMAVDRGMPDILARILPMCGMHEIQSKNKSGHTPLMIAKNRQRTKCEVILRRYLS